MITFQKCIGLLTTCLVVLLYSCSASSRNEAGVQNSMKYYDHLIEKLDADSIALLYTPQGRLGTLAVGRDSIRKFLFSFKNVKVLSQKSTTTSIKLYSDSAIQKGNYIQTDILSEKDTIVVKGEYTAHWLWIKKEGWRINFMETKPIKN